MTYFFSKQTNGFYHNTIHQTMPKDAIEIDDATYHTLLNGQASGKVITSDENGNPTLIEATQPSLDAIKNNLKTKIDNDAESERLKYITSGVGQALTYQEKVNQALDYSGKYAAYLKDNTNPLPNDEEYPLLKACLGIDGDTLLEVAESVTLSYVLWQQIGAEIEKIRLNAKAEIEAAKTKEDAQTIYDNVAWPNS